MKFNDQLICDLLHYYFNYSLGLRFKVIYGAQFIN